MTLRAKFRVYWSLIKSLQTGLLLVTGWAGFMSCRCPVTHLPTLLALTASLFLAISGATVLNMWYDHDIDARMQRTCWRPLPMEQVSSQEALLLGLILVIIGLGWALTIDYLYGAIIFAGVFFDVIIYTMWLKRRTPWSVIFGGISGGMPILAGRALALGYIDWVGVALSLAVLFWIPTHILTFSMRFFTDYENADIPTFPAVFGFQSTRVAIAISSVVAALAMAAAAYGIGLTWGYMRLLAVLSLGLLIVAIASTLRPSDKLNFGLFKYASLYMLGAMLIIIFEAI